MAGNSAWTGALADADRDTGGFAVCPHDAARADARMVSGRAAGGTLASGTSCSPVAAIRRGPRGCAGVRGERRRLSHGALQYRWRVTGGTGRDRGGGWENRTPASHLHARVRRQRRYPTGAAMVATYAW